MESREFEKLLNSDGKEFREKITVLMKEDDDFYSFILWSFVVAYHKIQSEIEVLGEGGKENTNLKDDEMTNTFKNIEKWEKGHLFNKLVYMTSLL